MPYPSEHAARLLTPNFERYRRHNDKFGKGIAAIWGIRKGTAYLQAIRFSADIFTPSEAKKWLADHGYKPILFESATRENPMPDYPYIQFHGRNPTKREKIFMRYPKTLIQLGRAHAIEYVCDKFNGGGDGRQAIYRHKFGTGAILCRDEKDGQLYILGKNIRVTDAGIEG